ncbi:MAG: OsmC family protein [Pseudomonadota bacterium]
MHRYSLSLTWTGNLGRGTVDYRSYSRDFTVSSGDKPSLLGSSDPAFRGDAHRWNPEELLLASIAGCHKLWYLHLCADAGIVVTAYTDSATATMERDDDGITRITGAVLNPVATIATGHDRDLALALHTRAREECFIANSVNFPIEHQPRVIDADDARAHND